jgi:diguanylate cyclase (GGDEF)-like protein/PAS domain S-box-containing protein
MRVRSAISLLRSRPDLRRRFIRLGGGALVVAVGWAAAWLTVMLPAGSRRLAAMVAGVTVSALVLFALGCLVLRVGTRGERRNQRRVRAMLQSSSEVITMLAADGTVLYQSPAVERILGYRDTELVGARLADILHPDDVERVLANYRRLLERTGVRDEPIISRWRCGDGSYRQMESVRHNLLDHPDLRCVAVHSRDVTDRVALERKLKQTILHDPLTGLPNRALFEDRLARSLSTAEGRGARAAVALIDVDDFKGVNETLGQAAGDQLLATIARRLARVVNDGETVARTGGDEFAIKFASTSRAAATEVAERALRSIAETVELRGEAVRVTACAGVALASGGETADELTRNADIALWQAKALGAGRTRTYEPTMLDAARNRFDLTRELRRAVEQGEFVLHYQPIVAFAGRHVVGFEALIRWAHPERGLLAPASFLELAEETGLIVDIGDFVAREACRQARAWQLRYPRKPLSMAINVSFTELEQDDLVARITKAVSDAGIDATRLVVEVTESAMMRDIAISMAALDDLKRLGVQLAIDDFGTGYSSLSHLERLPFDTLKLPKPFVDGIAEDREESPLAHGIIALGRNLGMRTVAEGVETAHQLRRLDEMGCELAQGYLLAKPASAAEVEARLDRGDQSSAPHEDVPSPDRIGIAWRRGENRS